MSKSGKSTRSRFFRGIYRDRENGWLFGVCAGIAEYAGFNVSTVRVVTVIIGYVFTLPVIILYGLATVLLPEKPLIYSGGKRESTFWRKERHADRWSGQ